MAINISDLFERECGYNVVKGFYEYYKKYDKRAEFHEVGLIIIKPCRFFNIIQLVVDIHYDCLTVNLQHARFTDNPLTSVCLSNPSTFEIFKYEIFNIKKSIRRKFPLYKRLYYSIKLFYNNRQDRPDNI